MQAIITLTIAGVEFVCVLLSALWKFLCHDALLFFIRQSAPLPNFGKISETTDAEFGLIIILADADAGRPTG